MPPGQAGRRCLCSSGVETGPNESVRACLPCNDHFPRTLKTPFAHALAFPHGCASTGTHQPLNTQMHIRRCMGSKTISLEDSAYELLRDAKREGESFSMVVRRLLEPERRDPLSRVIGLMEGEKGDGLLRITTEMRERDRAETAERHRRLGLE